MKTIEGLVDEKLIGIPHALGKCEYDGADCVGVAVLWYRTQGIEFDYNDGKGPVDLNWFNRTPRRILDAILEFGDVVHFHQLKKYDILLLYGNEIMSTPSGIAVMVDPRHILTSVESRGSFVEMLNMYWKSKFYGAIRPHKIKHLQED